MSKSNEEILGDIFDQYGQKFRQGDCSFDVMLRAVLRALHQATRKTSTGDVLWGLSMHYGDDIALSYWGLVDRVLEENAAECEDASGLWSETLRYMGNSINEAEQEMWNDVERWSQESKGE